MPHKELLDPQGKAVLNNLGHLHLNGITDVRIGRHVQLVLDASDEVAAAQMVEIACQKLLANGIVETFHFVLKGA